MNEMSVRNSSEVVITLTKMYMKRKGKIKEDKRRLGKLLGTCLS